MPIKPSLLSLSPEEMAKFVKDRRFARATAIYAVAKEKKPTVAKLAKLLNIREEDLLPVLEKELK